MQEKRGISADTIRVYVGVLQAFIDKKACKIFLRARPTEVFNRPMKNTRLGGLGDRQ